MTLNSESRKEANQSKLLSSKSAIRIAAWNVRTMYQAGKSHTIAKEMRRYNVELLGLSETRWIQSGKMKLGTGEMIIYSGHPDEDAHHTEGVALMLGTQAQKALLGWEPVCSRIITAKFQSSNRRIHLKVVQCYAPTNDATLEDKLEFYQMLDKTLQKKTAKEVTILMGDFNAKIGADNIGFEEVMGKHGLGKMNENGELFASSCAENNMVIGGSIFPHKETHKVTWRSPDNRTENQIDHICISKKFRSSLQDVRSKRGADAATDHHLVIAKLRLKLKKCKNSTQGQKRFNVALLSSTSFKQKYCIELTNRYQALQQEHEGDISLTEKWQKMKSIWLDTCDEVVGKRKRKHQEWISPDTLQKVEKRRELKEKVNCSKTRAAKQAAAQLYSEANIDVKKSARRDKRDFVDRLTEEAEAAAGQGNMKALYDTTRKLAGKFQNASRPVKSKNGQTLNTTEEQLGRWAEHFKELLNQVPPPDKANIPPAAVPLEINTMRPTKVEIRKAIKLLKNNKAPGPDDIPAEALKTDVNTSTDMLYDLFGDIWTAENIPEEWKDGHLVKLPKKGDLSDCGNYRGIMLLSAPGKVLNRILLQRLKAAVDKKLRDHQAGFRMGRACADQIAALRIILEQSLEYNTSLYVNFIDFEKAFDSLDRDVMWQLLRHYGIPEKLITIIRTSYNGMQCRVVHEGQLSEAFDVNTGVRQGCLLSPFLFLLAVDWIMIQTTQGRRNGIQWTLHQQLDDLDFADDIALLSHSQKQMQEKSKTLYEVAATTGLRVSIKKTQVLRVNANSTSPIVMNGNILEEVDNFRYLGSVLDKNGGTDEDIKARIGKARTAFVMLGKIWKATNISVKTKLKLFNSNVKPVLLYGSETWRTTKRSIGKVQAFVNNCLRRIMRIWWPDKIRNEQLWQITEETPVVQQILKRKWGWIGHTLRKPATSITRQALQWNPQGKRKPGRPRNSWRRDTKAEMEKMQCNWKQLETLAQNRTRWRQAVCGLCSLTEYKA